MQDSPADLAAFYGIGELTGFFRFPEDRIRRLQNVSVDDVRAVAERLFQPRELSAVVVGDLTASQRRAVDRAIATLA